MELQVLKWYSGPFGRPYLGINPPDRHKPMPMERLVELANRPKSQQVIYSMIRTWKKLPKVLRKVCKEHYTADTKKITKLLRREAEAWEQKIDSFIRHSSSKPDLSSHED